MCELNLIELAWADVKRYVMECNLTGDLSFKKIKEVTESAMKSITWSDCKHVKKLERELWQKEEVINCFVITVGGIKSSNEDEDCNSNEKSVFVRFRIHFSTELLMDG